MKKRFIQGNEAVVHGALAAGAKFFAGYPITPSSEIAEKASELLPREDGVFLQMEDEIASMAAVMGASVAGLKAFTATSGLGFSLMQEHVGYACMCEIPCVIVEVQRGGPATGQPTKPCQADLMQVRYGTNGDHSIIALSPSSVQECYDLTVKAFYYAEKYRTPVIVLTDACIGHLMETVDLRDLDMEEVNYNRIPDCPPSEYTTYRFNPDECRPMVPFGKGYELHFASGMHDENGQYIEDTDAAGKLVTYLTDKIEKHIDEISLVKEINIEDADVVMISFGCSVRSSLGAIDEFKREGIKAGLLQLQTVWPMPVNEVKKVLNTGKTVVVPELSLGQLYGEISKLNNNGANIISVTKVNGELIYPKEIVQAVREGTSK